jgi:hypothetical protein
MQREFDGFKKPLSKPLPLWGRGFEIFIFRSKLGIILPLSVSERDWGEVHRTHVNAAEFSNFP